jgi:2-succinyl-6-hydroxy-2,4-cyclohexadiene-1-carboxylate synthase
MPTATIDGVDLYFEVHGAAGEPLVLVHGYTGDITDWRFQLPEFSKTHRVLAFDHRGHGRSQAPSDRSSYTILRMADDVEALARHAGFERYHLLGHSMGGAVVQEIALRHPGRLLSLTLEDTSYRFGFRNEAVEAWAHNRHRLAEEDGMTAVADMPPLTPPPPHLPAERREEERARLTRMSVDAFIGAWYGLRDWPGAKERLGEIATSTLVICGELDATLVAPSRNMAEMIPDATLAIIPEAGHSPQYERPELFNAALRAHLGRNAAAASK